MYRLLIVLVSIVLLASCKKEDEVSPQEVKEPEVCSLMIEKELRWNDGVYSYTFYLRDIIDFEPVMTSISVDVATYDAYENGDQYCR